MRTFVAVILSVLVAQEQARAEPVSYSQDVTPIFNAHCVACHLTGAEHGSLALHPRAARGSLYRVPSRQSPLLLIDPGFPDQSYLIHKLTGHHLEVGGHGERMPMAKPELEPAEMAVVRRWILEGANEG